VVRSARIRDGTLLEFSTVTGFPFVHNLAARRRSEAANCRQARAGEGAGKRGQRQQRVLCGLTSISRSSRSRFAPARRPIHNASFTASAKARAEWIAGIRLVGGMISTSIRSDAWVLGDEVFQHQLSWSCWSARRSGSAYWCQLGLARVTSSAPCADLELLLVVVVKFLRNGDRLLLHSHSVALTSSQ